MNTNVRQTLPISIRQKYRDVEKLRTSTGVLKLTLRSRNFFSSLALRAWRVDSIAKDENMAKHGKPQKKG